MQDYDTQVFLNVPFDKRYKKLLDALVFAVHDCGFFARCALEREDGGEVRFDKIFKIIEACRYGIHDLSRTTLDATNRLPRFNMPLELGVFLGARRYGDTAQRRKSCMILERDKYRYQKFCSDIAGQDIRAHGNQATAAVRAVRTWLQANAVKPMSIPGPDTIQTRYVEFRRDLPRICKYEDLSPSDLSFLDYRNLVKAWIENHPRKRPLQRHK
jgi:hypothetical protein